MTLCKLNDRQGIGNELVFCDSSHALLIHKGIFQLPDEKYYLCKEPSLFINDLRYFLTSINNQSQKSHIKINFVIDWDTLFRVLLWRDENISVKGAYMLLIDAGLKREDIEPFFDSSLLDLFLSIYYSNRLEILRRLCSRAKKTIENKLSIKTECHLVPKGFDFITASSL
ncbi:MAG: hypothetical protein N2738_00010 [Thermodesulfovibrionales bacterium]|nr:hypothetical protein [Thermodesulfovibrionales bacterium]